MPEHVVEPRVTTASNAPTEIAVEKISNWELERLGTALSFGDNPLPLGIALKISKLATEGK
jgi:hypothetical protein